MASDWSHKKMFAASSASLCHSYNSCSEASPVLPVVQFPRHPQSSPNLLSGWDSGLNNMWKHNHVRFHLGKRQWKKKTENLWKSKNMIKKCMIIYHNLWTSGPNGSMTLKESKNINSHQHCIFTLIPFFPCPWCDAFLSNLTQETETLRFPSLYERAPDVANFLGADWAIKCAVCKELLQFNLGRVSGESYYVVI